MIALEELHGKPCAAFLADHFISVRLDEQFRSEGWEFRPQFRFQNAATSCLPLIEKGLAFGVFSPLSIWLNTQTGRQSGNIVYRRMANPIGYPFALLTPAHRPLARIAGDFLSLLEDELQSMLGELEDQGHLFRLG